MPIAFLVFFDLIYAILILVLFPGKYFISEFLIPLFAFSMD